MADDSETANTLYEPDLVSGGLPLNCTSNDVDISFAEITYYSINDPDPVGGFTPLPAGQEIDCVPGDQIYAITDAVIANNAQARYDFGLWINPNEDGSALLGDPGQCLHFNLIPDENGSTTEELGGPGGTPDACGDISADAETVTIPLDTLVLTCPAGGATTVTVDACAAWQNGTTGGNDRICPITPPGGSDGYRWGTTPGTTAKCRCEPLDLPINVKGVIRVDKVTVPTGDAQSFAFTGTNNSFPGGFNLTDASAPAVSDPLDAGTYVITETVPSGWVLTSAACVNTGTTDPADFSTTTNGVSVDLGSGGDVTCTFTNTKQASITIKKVTSPAEDPAVGSFTFSQTFDASGTFNLGHNGTKAFTNVAPNTAYTVIESNPSPGYALTAIACTGATTYTGTVATRTLSVTPGPGETIVCTFTNSRASVTVSKTTTETYTRTYQWDVDKSAGTETSIILDPGQVYYHPYSVTASVTGQTDDDHAVSGNITINNPNAFAVSVTAVSDAIAGVGAATVQCPVTLPYSLAGGGTLICTYSSDLPDGTTRLNTASVTLGGVSGTFDGTANVDFSGVDPTTVEDDCLTVKDIGDLGNTDPLGVVCVDAADGPAGAFDAPKTFNYTRLVPTDAAHCGMFTYDNTATGTTNTSATEITDDASIDVTIECPEGCTLTQGYWKTHNPSFAAARNGNGPPPDDAWTMLPSGELSGFFTTGGNTYPVAGPNPPSLTWYTVFWTAPKGNVYYNLAHQYMAAKLNVIDGVTPTAAVAAAITAAEDLFDTYTPAYVGGLKGNNALRAQFITLAGILGNFNEGNAGVEHCSEDASSTLQ